MESYASLLERLYSRHVMNGVDFEVSLERVEDGNACNGVECSCNDLGSRSLLRPISIPFACGASTGQAYGILP